MAQDEPIVAVVDTSALYGATNRARIVALTLESRFIGIWSPHIIGELFRVLTERWVQNRGLDAASRKELGRSAKAMMELLLQSLTFQDTSPQGQTVEENLRDADDLHLLVAARRANAAYIVSENTHDFPPADVDGRFVYDGVEFITPRKFFALIDVLPS